MKTISRWGYLIPLVFFLAGLLYARSINEVWASLGMFLFVIMASITLLIGIWVWRLTKKWYYGLLSLPIAFLLVLFFIRIIATI